MRDYEFEAGRGELHLAGESVPAGIYRMIGGRREVRFDRDDILPASLDGRVACYERVVYGYGEFRTMTTRRSGSV